jgi:hypothetical protein
MIVFFFLKGAISLLKELFVVLNERKPIYEKITIITRPHLCIERLLNSLS